MAPERSSDNENPNTSASPSSLDEAMTMHEKVANMETQMTGLTQMIEVQTNMAKGIMSPMQPATTPGGGQQGHASIDDAPPVVAHMMVQGQNVEIQATSLETSQIAASRANSQPTAIVRIQTGAGSREALSYKFPWVEPHWSYHVSSTVEEIAMLRDQLQRHTAEIVVLKAQMVDLIDSVSMLAELIREWVSSQTPALIPKGGQASSAMINAIPPATTQGQNDASWGKPSMPAIVAAPRKSMQTTMHGVQPATESKKSCIYDLAKETSSNMARAHHGKDSSSLQTSKFCVSNPMPKLKARDQQAQSVTKPLGQSSQNLNPRRLLKNRPLPDFGITISQLFRNLQRQGIMVPRPIRPLNPPYPKWYRPDQHCEYHMGVTGHSIDDCMAFRHCVWALIDHKIISFDGGVLVLKAQNMRDKAVETSYSTRTEIVCQQTSTSTRDKGEGCSTRAYVKKVEAEKEIPEGKVEPRLFVSSE